MSPRGTELGVAGHAFLWVAFAAAFFEIAILVARNAPERRAITLPRYHAVLAALSILICLAVLTAVVWKPSTWSGGTELGEGFYIVVGWTYGALVALAAAVVSAGVAIAAMRDHPALGSFHE